MSVIPCFINCESVSESTNENTVNNNVVKKFEKYRSKVELIQAEYEEAKTVIERLKEEINLYRDMEKRNSLEISSLKNQIRVLEERQKSFIVMSDNQRSIQKGLHQNDESIIEIKQMIQELEQKFQNIISAASKEAELIKQNRYYQSALQCKEETLKFLKTEMENSLQEKEELIQEYASRNTHLNEEVENLKSERDEIKEFYNKTVESYTKQIEEYDKIIEKMEKERRRILADYEVHTDPRTKHESTSENCNQDQTTVSSPSSMVTCSPEESQKKCESENSSLQTQITRFSYASNAEFKISKKNSFIGYSEKIPKSTIKQKQKIDFMHSCEPQMKRRLYPENGNDYLH